MAKHISDTPLRADEQSRVPITGALSPLKKGQPAVFWPWFGGLLLLGLLIVGIVTYASWNWLNNLQNAINANQPNNAVSSLPVQRSAPYADLNMTVLTVQYAPSFSDDPIHTGPSMVRINLRIQNPTTSTIASAYYDNVRLLVPKQQPLAPTNLHLPTPQAKTSTTGWLDFPVTNRPTLASLKLQFGNPTLNEKLVIIPMSGAYDASQYNAHSYQQSQEVDYYFKDYLLPGRTLIYHLTGVDVRDSYNGTETKAGQQFYVLNFKVDNPNSVDVAPGPGYFYIRIALNDGNRYPIASTLPASFNASTQGTSGSVAFVGPAGMSALTMVFLRQAVPGGDSYPLTLL